MKFSAALLSAAAIALFGATAAEAKQAKLDGQLVAGAVTKGGKVEAPVLLSEKTAKKLKLRSPLATLTTKGSKMIAAPNPAGAGTIQVAPSTLRAGDTLTGKAKLKGSAKKLMPKVKGSKLEITDRESAYSVDELTAAVVALYQQVGVLAGRVELLEGSLADVIAQLEALKAQHAGLADQVTNLINQIGDLQTALDALEGVVGTLPTAAELQAVIDRVDDLEDALEALEVAVGDLGLADDDLQAQIDTLETQLGAVQTNVTALLDDVSFLCEDPGLVLILAGTCPG